MGILIFGDGQFPYGIRFRIWAKVMFQLAMLQFSHWVLPRTPGPVTRHLTFCPGPSSQCYSSYAIDTPRPVCWTVDFKTRHLGTSPPLRFVGHKVGERHHMPTINAMTDRSVLDLTDDSCLFSLMCRCTTSLFQHSPARCQGTLAMYIWRLP